jgi:hypothetical protein
MFFGIVEQLTSLVTSQHPSLSYRLRHNPQTVLDERRTGTMSRIPMMIEVQNVGDLRQSI